MMKDEIFGPILPIMTMQNIDESISFVTARDKPLTIYYFGKNSSSNESLKKVTAKCSSGSLVVNDCGSQMANSDLPFGGVGASGYGRYHGKAGYENCSNKKSILYKDPINMWPFNVAIPPYTPDKIKLITLFATKLDYT